MGIRRSEYKGLGGFGVVGEHTTGLLYTMPKYDVDECRQKGITYADPLRVMVGRLVVRERADGRKPYDYSCRCQGAEVYLANSLRLIKELVMRVIQHCISPFQKDAAQKSRTITRNGSA